MEKITSKIAKLLSLATSSNENEAKLAAEKANELMVRYNLDMADIKEEPQYDMFIVESGTRMPVELKFIAGLLVKHFFVELVKGNHQLRMIGEKNNLENGKYLYSFLTNAFKQGWKEYQSRTQCDRSNKQTYYLGFYRGLDEKLTITRKKVEQEYGLMVVPDKGISKFVADTIGKTRNGGKTRIDNKDSSVYDSGKDAGGKLVISKGISNKSNNVGYLS